MKREEMIAQVRERSADANSKPWDVVVIGGGATGAGVAVDAASRGFSVLLLEREDFAKGTSSRSTKLVHGGVRYLEQGNISLVIEALKERGLLLQNAPHLVHDLQFVVPNYSWWEAPFYGIGLKVYDVLAGKYGFGKSKILTREETLRDLPTLEQDGLRGGIIYHDGQFDDARLLIDLMKTAADHGGVVVNYMPVVGLKKDEAGFIDGVLAIDSETSERFEIAASVVVNATGIFTDEIRHMDDANAQGMIAPSQGIHLVLDASFLRGDKAVMVPHTSDGRVLFAIPWHHHTVVGTTDTPINAVTYEPLPFEQEIEFVLESAGEYLTRKPTRKDVLSVYVGIRPLVKAAGLDPGKTSALSRDHTVHVDQSGLLTIVGGKWTTYRHMAEDTMNHAITLGKLEERPCVTRDLHIHGYKTGVDPRGDLWVYGSDAYKIKALVNDDAELGHQMNPALPQIAAEVVWAAREEMARSVEDVLARRTRALFLNARAAVAMAPEAARLLAKELGKDDAWAAAEVSRFNELAKQYMLEKIAEGNPPEEKKA
jgi:glycerol-3-phosphate dehydrogenase